MSDKPKKPKIPRAFSDGIDPSRIIPSHNFNCRSSIRPIPDEGRMRYLITEQFKPWVQLPNACAVPTSQRTITNQYRGLFFRDTYHPTTSEPDQAHLVIAVYAANHWLANFCAHARANYPMGGAE